jgi:two-component system, response regulator
VTRRRTILLVEDNQDDIDLTLHAFEQSTIASEIIIARDGVQALDLLFSSDEQRARPELVLLDLKLPKVDGLQVLQRIRADDRTRWLPVIVLSSSNEEQDLLRSYDLGANSFVRKPVDFGQFIDAARQLGWYWLVLNQTAPGEGPRTPGHVKVDP